MTDTISCSRYRYGTLKTFFEEAVAFTTALHDTLETHARNSPGNGLPDAAYKDAKGAVETVQDMYNDFMSGFSADEASNPAPQNRDFQLGVAFLRIERLLTPVQQVLALPSLKLIYGHGVKEDADPAERRAFVEEKLLSKIARLIP